MPRAVSVPIRQVIVARHQRGEPLAEIAKSLKLPFYTVRKLWRRFRDRGEAGLKPDYDHCGVPGERFERLIVRAALFLKRRHPRWGAPLIAVVLRDKWPDRHVPAPRSLQQWFRRHGLQPRRLRKPPQNRSRGWEPHEVWQMDATEHHRLAHGGEASWLTLVDERSGAILDAPDFPPRALAERPCPGRSGGSAGHFLPVGAAAANASGQWLPLGIPR